MIITCSYCSARYKVKDDLIGEKGKRVKCKKCNNVFVAHAPPKGENSVEQRQIAQVKVEVAKPTSSGSYAPNPATAHSQEEGQHVGEAQATVKVDRSQLESLLHPKTEENESSSAFEANDSQSTARMTVLPFQEHQNISPQSSVPSEQATVQMSRSIVQDALSQKSSSESPGPLETMKIDREQMQDFLKSNEDLQSGKTQSERNWSANEPLENADATQEVLGENGGLLQNGSEETQTSPAEGSLSGTADHEFPGLLEFEERSKADASFPSDEELGISQQASVGSDPSTPEENVADVHDFPEFETSKMAPLGNNISLSNQEDVTALHTDDRALSSQHSDSAEATPERVGQNLQEDHVPTPETPKGNTLYKAQIEGVIYPDLELKTLQRWVREGRLLEEDLIAVNESNHFKAALDYPEIGSSFNVFSSKQKTLKGDRAKVAPKKGVWHWLRSLFKRG